MIIDVLCSDGSPIGISSKTIWGDSSRIGLGGADLALITLCEELTKLGHTVTLFNSPREANASPFRQVPVQAFDPQGDRSVLIVARSPNPKAIVAKGLKVWWSCDQQTVGDFKTFAVYMDRIVCISEFHANYFKSTYGIDNTIVIDLPIRLDDFKDKDVEKVPKRLIFTSVPDRGLHHFLKIWKDIKKKVPDVSLFITSDYRLWGAPDPRNNQHRVGWIGQDDVMFVGALPREKYIEELLKAQMFVYPCEYEELFCISVAEAMVANVYPITSWTGALPTTNMGTIIPDFPGQKFFDEMVEKTVYFLENPEELAKAQKDARNKAVRRFNPDKIMKEWEDKVFK